MIAGRATRLTSGRRRSGRGDLGVQGGADAEREDSPGVERIDDPVVPQPGGRVVGGALALVLGQDRRLEGVALLIGLRGRRAPWTGPWPPVAPPITLMRAFGHIHSWRGP